MDNIVRLISNQLNDSNKQIANAQEEAILNFFGSKEEALRQINNYLIEEYSPELWRTGEYSYKMITNWRIRLKTEEEKAREKNTSYNETTH